MFLYRFLGLFSGRWPSFRGYRSRHSCCCSIWGKWGFSPWPQPFPGALNPRPHPLTHTPLLALATAPEDGSRGVGGSGQQSGTSNSSQKPCLAFSLASMASLSSRTRLSMLVALILVVLRGWPGEARVQAQQGPADPIVPWPPHPCPQPPCASLVSFLPGGAVPESLAPPGGEAHSEPKVQVPGGIPAGGALRSPTSPPEGSFCSIPPGLPGCQTARHLPHRTSHLAVGAAVSGRWCPLPWVTLPPPATASYLEVDHDMGDACLAACPVQLLCER